MMFDKLEWVTNCFSYEAGRLLRETKATTQGDPKASEKYDVDALKSMGMVGLYCPSEGEE